MTITETRKVAPNLAVLQPIPPPPPLIPSPPSPLPSPPPAKRAMSGAATLRPVPEVVEFYCSLRHQDTNKDSGCGFGSAQVAVNTWNVIGEIENRSAHLLAIKKDVKKYDNFIRFLIDEVETAAFFEINQLTGLVEWLDDELSCLVDERAVLIHFDWREPKSDAMREVAFGYLDFWKLKSEALTFSDDPLVLCAYAIEKMQSLHVKLENGVYSLLRMRERATM